MEPDTKINLKLEPAIVFFSTVMCLSVILLLHVSLKLVQQTQFSNRMHEVINTSQYRYVDINASYNNLKKAPAWDHDYDKMIVFKEQ